MMQKLKEEITAAANRELNRANEQFPLFTSKHEGVAVAYEELEESKEALEELEASFKCLWDDVRGKETPCYLKEEITPLKIADYAINLACEAVQTAAMLMKYEMRGIYKPGYIVHHKEYITPGNISNPNITLNLDNLEYVCEDCHNKEHKAAHTPMRYQYDANGNLLPPKENNKSDHTPGVQNLTPGKRTEGVTSKKLRKVARI